MEFIKILFYCSSVIMRSVTQLKFVTLWHLRQAVVDNLILPNLCIFLYFLMVKEHLIIIYKVYLRNFFSTERWIRIMLWILYSGFACFKKGLEL